MSHCALWIGWERNSWVVALSDVPRNPCYVGMPACGFHSSLCLERARATVEALATTRVLRRCATFLKCDRLALTSPRALLACFECPKLGEGSLNNKNASVHVELPFKPLHVLREGTDLHWARHEWTLVMQIPALHNIACPLLSSGVKSMH